MAKQPETTRHAAVWNPPRLHRLAARVAASGVRIETNQDNVWEGGGGTPSRAGLNHMYRVPTSGEPVTVPNPWQ